MRRKFSEATSKNLSQLRKGKYVGIKNNFFGKKHSESSKEKMKIAAKNRKPQSLELRQKQADIHMGEKGSNWQGGITALNRVIRKCFEYRQWRSDIFFRDDYTCLMCGIRGNQPGGYLHADHIKPFALILKENNIKTREEAVLCSELWSLNNGRTLCLGCHKKTDTYGGRTNNKE